MKFSVNLAQRKVTLFIGNKSYLGRIVTNQYQDSLEALLYSTQKSIVLQQKDAIRCRSKSTHCYYIQRN